MLSQFVVTGTPGSPASERIFIYEIEGLHYDAQNGYPIRNSGKTLLQVPYSRMSEQMQRISRLGGKIVSIKLLSQQNNDT